MKPIIYSATAAAAAAAAAAVTATAVDDCCGLYVRLSLPDMNRYAYDQYLFDISSSKNKEKENISFPSFDSFCNGGSCRGLLYLHHRKGATVILNPIRREFKFLPPSTVKRPRGTTRSYYRACGLGFDSQSKDYKVVRFVVNYREICLDDGSIQLTGILDGQVELYSLKNNYWREIEAPKELLKVMVRDCGIYLNNTSKCYWVAYSRFSVISFDFEKEILCPFMPLPQALPTLRNSQGSDCVFDGLRIFEYMGSLAVIGYKKCGECTLFEAYIRIEQEYRWEKKFVVEVSGDHRPLGFWNNGRSLFLQGNDAENKCYQLQVFDVIDLCLEKLPIFADDTGCMEILSCVYDDPDATIVLPGAKQFFVDKRMEFEISNHTSYRSKSMASRPQVSVGCTEQDQDLQDQDLISAANKKFELRVADLLYQYCKKLSTFSHVESTLLGAKQFFVDEHVEIDNPINHHPNRKQVLSKRRTVGCTEQCQGLNKGIAAVSCTEQGQGLNKRRAAVGCTEQGQGLNKRRAAVGSFLGETSTMCVKRSNIPSRPKNNRREEEK